VSDQDFFFDEDEKPAASTGAKKGSASAKTAAPAPRGTESADAQSVTLMVAVLIGVIGLLLGVVIGLFVGKSMATPAITATTTGVGAAVSAPQLTQEQINAGAGALPEGHPAVGAPAAETTAK
jgi:hypothetical protein